jgi:hypothetical protein
MGYLIGLTGIKGYIFLVVSFLEVSFFTVSTTVVFVESTTLVVSEELVDFAPLHAAKDTASSVIKLNLIMFFILIDWF